MFFSEMVQQKTPWSFFYWKGMRVVECARMTNDIGVAATNYSSVKSKGAGCWN